MQRTCGNCVNCWIVSFETRKRIFQAKGIACEGLLCYTDHTNQKKGGISVIEIIAVNLPLLVCFVVGIALLVVEAFVPGFGLPGISGVVMEIVAIVLTWVNHGPVAALGLTIIVLALIAIAISVSLRSATKGKLSRSKLVLQHQESNEAGYRSQEDMKVFLGKEGKTTTVLRPTGMAEFDGVKLNVVSEGEFVPAGTRVRIALVEGSRIVVRVVKG